MAAIDKLYAHSYYQYDSLLRWALIYYPKLLIYFYDIHMTYDEFEKRRKEYIKETRRNNEASLRKIGGSNVSTADAVANLQYYYRKIADYKCPAKQAKEEVAYIKKLAKMTDDEIADLYSMPIASTPFEVDLHLKWFCPLPFVREYLHNQCGVDPNKEWIYRWWFKGKKAFSI